MYLNTLSLRHRAQALAAVLGVLIFGGAALADTYDPRTHQLAISSVTIGAATMTDAVVAVGTIVSGPTGTAAIGGEDTYDTVTRQLTVPKVAIGNSIYANLVTTVDSVVSIGTLSGPDTYDGTYLRMSYVQVGGSVYGNVVITVGRVVSPGGGMPNSARSVYDPASGRLTIPAIQVGSRVYTNAVVTIGKIVSVGGPGIAGNVSEGPTTPVCMVGVPCTGPFANAELQILDYTTHALVGRAMSNSSGNFIVSVPEGEYLVQVMTVYFPRCPEQVVTVTGQDFAFTQINCDTGIR
jgi:hypothetical protein